ncbi:precorrin-6y C5,15-methyltransferase (decarboxylating) subunit CbiE [Gordonia terrae]|uniref:precorrin-6y C5,15-methyltransferase (decarboxylating) subunit CbiE n=1 Tax=Gordonia terrae TaxID=2055 RepID=UPI00200A7778|nr:precorrin-6y C5,15-methyltransferase (decarboxylating) subunit CbiE [Gordonia terrae]UPW11518.1 precorrin-6y C5,15-methyltransferase (decarboxylating) subunit CbiE [Gordonia terrae]
MTAPDTTHGSPPASEFVVIGIGADGWPGLGETVRDELRRAQVIYGAARQLALLDGAASELGAQLRPWRSPMSEHLAEVVAGAGSAASGPIEAGAGSAASGPIKDGTAHAGIVHILASGDPMFHGVGASIIGRVGADRVRVYPAVSSASLACARLGWDLATTRIVSAVRAEPSVVLGEVTDGARVLILSRDETTPAAVATLLVDAGFGSSTMTVLEQLGGPAEQIATDTAESWRRRAGDPLNIVAVDCVGPRRSRLPGRPDDAYEHDGQITKSTIRALTVCALGPTGAQTLWDIGSGSGSVAIEWLRADDRGTVVAFERDSERAERLRRNAARHGVAHRLTVRGPAPDELADAPRPDAVFIGGGLDEEILSLAWAALADRGRLVVNAVTVENQALVTRRHGELGGTLRRLSVETVAPLGTMSTWRPALPIVQWAVDKPAPSTPDPGPEPAEAVR